ncbi:MAG: LysM peptidoglycan-binding domain-containing protein [Lewinellaceae bacterium]|nr:LysM peptidoglycan-binding domain-containing protein [Lewinellaceae bacterium]
MSVFTTYKVQPGDTLYGISRKFGMGVDEIKAINSLKSNNLSVGQTLKVRSSGAVVTPAPAPKPVTPAPQPTTSSSGSGSFSTYKVAPGDTLYGISRKLGVGVDELKSINGLTSNNLAVGQILKVRSTGSTVTPTPTPVPTPVPPTPQPTTPPFTGDYLSARLQFPVEVRPDAGFTRYLITVPLLNGGQVLANMRDNVSYSPYMLYPQGIMYGGQSQIELDVATIQSVGLTAQQAKALQYVSTHEGKFDAINSYDKAIFSYGFIQFTGAAAVGASLNRVMASMKMYAPAAFQRVFQRVGIDSEGSVTAPSTTVLSDNGAKLRGDEAWLYIQRNIRMYGAFVQAGFEPSLVREQLRMANTLYIQTALNFKLDVILGGLRVVIPRLGDILSSEAALTAVFAIAINQGVGGMSRIVSSAVGVVGTQNGLTSPQMLSRVDEQQVVQYIATTHADERVRTRAQGVLNSDLSFGKNS